MHPGRGLSRQPRGQMCKETVAWLFSGCEEPWLFIFWALPSLPKLAWLHSVLSCFVYVCVYACMYACARAYVCTHVCAYMFMHVCMLVYVSVYMSMRVCVCVFSFRVSIGTYLPCAAPPMSSLPSLTLCDLRVVKLPAS